MNVAGAVEGMIFGNGAANPEGAPAKTLSGLSSRCFLNKIIGQKCVKYSVGAAFAYFHIVAEVHKRNALAGRTVFYIIKYFQSIA